MNQGVRTIIYPVKDLAASKALFNTLLGVEPIADARYYVGWNIDGQNIGLDPNGFNSGMTGPLAFYQVDDIRASLRALLDAGCTLDQDVRNVGGGRQVASVRDANGNPIGLTQD
jgi:predicted enzyme related to lactoylglutathione lyase